MTDYCVVLVTCANRKEAKAIGTEVVKLKLAACANIINQIHSLFVWKKKLRSEKECLIIFKTRLNRFARLSRQVIKMHSYFVPEIIALPIISGNREYLNWVKLESGGRN
ncbi:MAG: divalent-cation tolerance protein CutA [candidate division Zixibacteria bacterium]|nr:divalent-cation tolerance protein CutA [candidate division Zixibacteria bacterium]